MDPLKSRAFSVCRAGWKDDGAALRSIRAAVFVIEQKVPEDEEWDGMDAACLHALALDAGGTPIGTGRLAPDGKIGRMAVLKEWRGAGVGTALLGWLIETAGARNMTECHMSAQSHALSFYSRHGFEVYGAEFLEAGIPHRHMRRRL